MFGMVCLLWKMKGRMFPNAKCWFPQGAIRTEEEVEEYGARTDVCDQAEMGEQP